MKAACPACGHIHTTADARAVGRFTGGTTAFVAAHAGTPVRATRAEAEADECAWRIAYNARRQAAGLPSPTASADAEEPATSHESAETSAPFPAAEMETLARAKAWHDFLAQAWLRRCREELVSA